MKICPHCENEITKGKLCSFCWPEKVCSNCKKASRTLAVRNLCAYCDKTIFIERIVESKKWDKENINKKVKDNKIKISKEELKNIKISIKAFYPVK